ncbi:MAG TPA: hypothetical protein VNA25_15220, partial [Phycisphaerae bacterium]|nr:hypothetical protein [Phycisphaerae bacterium]
CGGERRERLEKHASGTQRQKHGTRRQRVWPCSPRAMIRRRPVGAQRCAARFLGLTPQATRLTALRA